MRYSDRSNMGKRYAVAILAALISAILFGFLLNFVITKIEYATYKKPQEYAEFVEKYSEKYDVPEHIIWAVIKAESGFDYTAKSSVGAIGLMQMMPETFEDLTDNHLKEYFDSGMLFDAETNIRYGTYYLAYLYRYFGDWSVALAAYNAGLGNVNEWLADERYSFDGQTLDKIPFKETRDYVAKVERYTKKYNKLYDQTK